MRVRTSHRPDGWLDLGPCPEVTRSRAHSIPAAPIGDMSPVIVDTVLTALHDSRKGVPKALSIRPDNPRPLCGLVMRIAKEPCAMPKGHKDSHRTSWAATAAAVRWAKRGAA